MQQLLSAQLPASAALTISTPRTVQSVCCVQSASMQFGQSYAGHLPEHSRCCVKGGLGTIVAGDLNCPPDSLEMFIFRALLPDLHDSWEHLHPQQPGFTSNAMDNSFSKPGKFPLQALFIERLTVMLYLLVSSELWHETVQGGLRVDGWGKDRELGDDQFLISVA